MRLNPLSAGAASYPDGGSKEGQGTAAIVFARKVFDVLVRRRHEATHRAVDTITQGTGSVPSLWGEWYAASRANVPLEAV